MVMQKKRINQRVIVLYEQQFCHNHWNRTPHEFVRGLRKRGLEVIAGSFVSSPLLFATDNNGEILHLEDFDEHQGNYILFIFGYSKDFYHKKTPFDLEKLSYRKSSIWIEMGNEALWDNSLQEIAKYIHVFPCNTAGLLAIAKMFCSEQSQEASVAIKNNSEVWDYIR